MPQNSLLISKRPVGTFSYIGKDIGFDEFYWSFTQMVAMQHEFFLQPGTYVHLDHSTISGQVQARNELVVKMQGDWLLQLDSDHAFDPDLAYQLLDLFETQKLDVLCGFYAFKGEPHNPVLWQYLDGEYRNIADWGDTAERKAKLIPVGAAGAGCLLVRRSVFQRLYKEFNALPFSAYGGYNTDDFAFFEKCRVLGIQCWCAPQIECKHLRIQGIGISDYDRTCSSGGIATEQMVMR